jgi:hypothetical protein
MRAREYSFFFINKQRIIVMLVWGRTKFSFEMGSEFESRRNLRPQVMRDRTRGSFLSFLKLFPRNQNQRPQEQELNQFFKRADLNQKTPKSKMKLTLPIALFVLASLGTALPVIFSLPAAPALLSKNEKLPTNSSAPLAPRTLVRGSTNTGLIVGLAVVGFFVVGVIGSILFCNSMS